MPSNLDMYTSQQVFRKDHKMVLAMNRHQAAIVGVRLAYEALGYSAGQVLARNSVSGVYGKYATGGSSGLDTATGVLFFDVKEMLTSTTDIGDMIVKGQVYESQCIDLDSAAKVDLGARSVIDMAGNTIMMF